MARRIIGPELMTPAEVGEAFRVDPQTAVRWAKAGKLRSIKTPGLTGHGHHRFYRAEVEALLNGTPLTAEQLDALIWGRS